VIDTVGERERFGEERLAEALSGAADATDAVRRIDSAVAEFASGPQADDTAVLAVERVSAVDPADDPDALVIGGSSPA
jgi:serine phosphatase RsbU (regulator of sigma subunit)